MYHQETIKHVTKNNGIFVMKSKLMLQIKNQLLGNRMIKISVSKATRLHTVRCVLTGASLQRLLTLNGNYSAERVPAACRGEEKQQLEQKNIELN